MKAAPLPENESERLSALLEYDILDTPAEFSYDDIALLASSVCDTPIALVSLIDSDRQWFKAKHGLVGEGTSRDESFCAHAIHKNEVFIVNDATTDERFADNPLVMGDPHVRFYAGAPLINPKGFALGTLCVIDKEARTLSPQQEKALKTLARQVVSQLEQRRLSQVLQRNYEELQKSTRQICDQQAMLVHASKMSALGVLSAGIAHEINNPLSVISGKLWKVQRNIEENKLSGPETASDIEVAEKALRRATNIIKGLTTYARDCQGDPLEMTLLEEVINDFTAVTKESLYVASIGFDVIGKADFYVPCRSAEIIQVLLNLLNNSVHALESVPEKWIRLSITKDSSQAVLKFTDSGPGISPEVQKKMMDPFFTTKPTGQGTGLGLSISKGLIESNGGTLSFLPAEKHTTFCITLPLGAGVLL